ncbi:ATP-binding cassette domain-containing protein [Coleofasciculus sp. FACHB-1120]|uniref:ATP-binding cassette domain-containing protein n=1 Tax=Coleofasciculus sp. FACHB-1120 TaxID=2692783 RepID=UPI0016861448|nr:ATP-binding cassette domain-containing protein [Coleofasciculus sp. FACHB-1120]MBD2740569.1 ATP-binding cassette domain-containing protein [Coleofasciculus sp. FACHB-1120]
MTSQSGQRTVISTNPYLVLNNQGQILPPLELTAERHRLGRDRAFADLIVPDDWRVISACQAVLHRDGDDYYIYDGDGRKPSTNKLFVDHRLITPTEGYRLENGIEIQIGQNPQNLIQLRYFNPSSAKMLTPPRPVSLKNRSVEIGRDANATMQLDSPIVSRRHATIDTDSQGRYILQDRSTNGVFINGQRVTGSAVLSQGTTIRIGSFTLVLRGDNLVVLDRGNQIRLDAENLAIERRLDDVSLAIEPGQFVALVGGSGTGKSTLLKALLGIEKTTQGAVYLNGDNLQKNFNLYRTQIGYVPQDDILHRDLTVVEVLTYAAALRLPPDTDVEVVQKTLTDIEMSDRQDALIKHLSGGQRKRVSIGVELLADPKLFFLDEPTSGLDPGLDKKMMQMLRRLADQGRTIVLVTHATANIKMCDRVAFLGRGGRLCYYGIPEDALKFFGVTTDNFADIYTQLDRDKDEDTEAIVQQYAHQFRQSPDYQHYVANSLGAGSHTPQNASSPSQKASISLWKQLALLSGRYLKMIGRDRIYLALSVLTSPIGIALIPLAIGGKNPLVLSSESDPALAPLALRVLFVFTCAAIWVGLSSSLQEIVKESAIYLRERLVNLGLIPYLVSKILVLSGLALLQSLLISAVILIGFKSPQPELMPWSLGFTITTFLTLVTSMSLGLLVSSLVKNSSQANSALPLLLLPQIIFSGVLFKMEGIASKISWLMLSRWSIGGYGSLVNVNAMVPEPIFLPNGTLAPMPFDKTPIYDPTWQNLGLNWGILLLHAAVYLTVTFWIQKRKDIF